MEPRIPCAIPMLNWYLKKIKNHFHALAKQMLASIGMHEKQHYSKPKATMVADKLA